MAGWLREGEEGEEGEGEGEGMGEGVGEEGERQGESPGSPAHQIRAGSRDCGTPWVRVQDHGVP